MGKMLVLFIQSETVDLYVNVITHCVNAENVNDFYFVGQEVMPEQEADLFELIQKVYNRISGLSYDNDLYKKAQLCLPKDYKHKILRLDYSNLTNSINKIEDLLPNKNNILVDVSATSKQLSVEILILFYSVGFFNLYHFVMSNKVYDKTWKKSKLYHDLIDDDRVVRFSYTDFSKSLPIRMGFKKFNSQNSKAKTFIIISIVLVVVTIGLPITLENAQVIQITSIVTLLGTSLSLILSWLTIKKMIAELK